MYQAINLGDLAPVGVPIERPPEFGGLTDEVLADFSAWMDPPPVGYEGKGLWPLIVSQPTDLDPSTEAVTTEIENVEPDDENKRVLASYGRRPLTEDEIAANAAAFANPPIIGTRYAATMALDDDGALVKLVAAGDGSTGFSEAAEQSPGDLHLYMWPVPPSGYIVKVDAPGFRCSTYEVDTANGVVGVCFYSLATGEKGRPPGDFHPEVQW
jgi:hypothetical protein